MGGGFGGMGDGGRGRYGGGGGMGGGRGDNFGNYDSQTGHCIHMRGLPFAASEQDILDVSWLYNTSIYQVHVAKYLTA